MNDHSFIFSSDKVGDFIEKKQTKVQTNYRGSG